MLPFTGFLVGRSVLIDPRQVKQFAVCAFLHGDLSTPYTSRTSQVLGCTVSAEGSHSLHQAQSTWAYAR